MNFDYLWWAAIADYEEDEEEDEDENEEEYPWTKV